MNMLKLDKCLIDRLEQIVDPTDTKLITEQKLRKIILILGKILNIRLFVVKTTKPFSN